MLARLLKLIVLASVVLGLTAIPLASANFSKGGFSCNAVANTTWKAGVDATGTWYGPGYTTTGAAADLSYAAPSGTDQRVLMQAIPMPAAGTYLIQLRARVTSANQNMYWHVLGVTNGTTLSLVNNGVPQTITQQGVKSLVRVSATANGSWASYSNSFTITANDVATYQYYVVALVASRLSAQVAQFDDVYTTAPATTVDSRAGLTAQWFNTPQPVSSLSAISWTNPIKTTKEEQINWPATNSVPFVAGVPNQYFACRITGNLTIPTTGSWTFSLGADDGTSLILNNVTLIAPDGLHSYTTRSVTRTMNAGVYPIEVKYFENTGTHGLALSWFGPNMTATEIIPSSAFQNRLRVLKWTPVSADE